MCLFTGIQYETQYAISIYRRIRPVKAAKTWLPSLYSESPERNLEKITENLSADLKEIELSKVWNSNSRLDQTVLTSDFIDLRLC